MRRPGHGVRSVTRALFRMADGGAVREELTRVDRPTAFGYVLSEVSGPLKFLAGRVEGLWTFLATDDGTRVTWEWTVHSGIGAGRSPVAGICRDLAAIAKRSLENIAELLPAGVTFLLE